MELTALINAVTAVQVIGYVERKDVTGITADSRAVQKGSIFCAVRGFATDGHRYIQDAIRQGAIAVVLEDAAAVPDQIFTHAGVTKIVVQNSRAALAALAHSFYKYPTKRLRVTGITGTNGKTSTATLLAHIFNTAGVKSGLLGTIVNVIGNEVQEASLTTPDSPELCALFSKMLAASCASAVMEVSSHALALERVAGIDFNAAVFTNITSDHLDFHGSFESYFEAKHQLFTMLHSGVPVIYNADDPYSAAMVAGTPGRPVSYGKAADADYCISGINFNLNGTSFTVSKGGAAYPVFTPLIGEFNAFNATAAFAAAVEQGVMPELALAAIATAPHVPGRFQVVGTGAKKAVVDYAHTTDSLTKTLRSLRAIVGNAAIVTVFGCGGDRDATKRPLMGAAAEALSDAVYVTNDNPRNEDPLAIINGIVAGMRLGKHYIMPDRAEAIAAAIAACPNGGVVLIAGKGHESYQLLHGVKHHFSDVEVAAACLNREEQV